MKKVFRRSLTTVALLCLAVGAGAQDRDSYHHDRDDRWRGEAWRGRLFSQVREDLDHVQGAWFSRGGDRYRIERTKQELNELQESLVNGRYNERELREVIGALRRVVADNRLSRRDRDILNEDLRRLEDYREHHEHWRR
jgi:hypothetical protein